MREFALYLTEQSAFPRVVYDSRGKAFDIDGDYRMVIKILDLYGDKDVIDTLKLNRLLKWFYKNGLPDEREIFPLMFKFIAGYSKATNDTNSKQNYDFSFDADVIYASFLREYGVDLIEIPFLHWYKFRMMLAGLSAESPFKLRLEIRNTDLSGISGKRLSQLKAAKDAVRIPDRVFAEETFEREEFIRKWG